MAKSLAFFNNKGGVGKTTLACNMASMVASRLALKVLVVDCDPQCNATQLLMTEEQWEEIYDDTKTSHQRSVLKTLRHIRAGDSDIDRDLPVYKSRRFSCDVLPGHPGLAAMEDRLSGAWVGFLSGDLGGLRKSVWAAAVVATTKYDLIVFDVGPSLGALNRSVLLGSDFFVTPMAPDLFSLYALENISEWTTIWIKAYERAYVALEEEPSTDPRAYGIPSTPRTKTAFAGYTVQQYVTRSSGGQLRNVKAYDRYSKEIPKRAKALHDLEALGVTDMNLGIVPNMFAMVPLAQAVHAPITALTLQDGLKGGQVNQQARYAERLNEIAERLIENIGLSGQSSAD